MGAAGLRTAPNKLTATVRERKEAVVRVQPCLSEPDRLALGLHPDELGHIVWVAVVKVMIEAADSTQEDG